MEKTPKQDGDSQLAPSLQLILLREFFSQLLSQRNVIVSSNGRNLNLFFTIDSRQSPRAVIDASSRVTQPVAAIAKAKASSTTSQASQNRFFFADQSGNPDHAADRRNATAITEAAMERDQKFRLGWK